MASPFPRLASQGVRVGHTEGYVAFFTPPIHNFRLYLEVVGLTGSVTAPDLQSFTPDSATTLSASTKYFVVFKGTSSGTNPILQQASSGTVDPGFATGWEIPVGVLNSTDSGSTWSVRISSQSYKIQIKGTAVGGTTNTAPTAADKTVTTGEDRAYAFTADDFGFADDDAGATLASVTIVTTPALGTLALDGTAVMADDVVTTAQIDGDMLTFTPARDAHGDPYTTFTFTVNDGTDDSASAYTMTIDVTDAPVPVCGVPDIAGAGRRQIWTGTVTVERVLRVHGKCYWLRIRWSASRRHALAQSELLHRFEQLRDRRDHGFALREPALFP